MRSRFESCHAGPPGSLYPRGLELRSPSPYTCVHDGEIYTWREHVFCGDKTYGWEHDDWEFHDVYEFRRHSLGESEEEALKNA